MPSIFILLFQYFTETADSSFPAYAKAGSYYIEETRYVRKRTDSGSRASLQFNLDLQLSCRGKIRMVTIGTPVIHYSRVHAAARPALRCIRIGMRTVCEDIDLSELPCET